MRLVAWNCAMALHRKWDALMALRPDIAVVPECACPEVLTARGVDGLTPRNMFWMGRNPNKGLGVFAFNGFTLSAVEPFFPTLCFILPIEVRGPTRFHLLATWAQNASAGMSRKHQLGPLRRALTKYRDFLHAAPAFVAGDLNNNIFWDRPGWRINHAKAVDQMAALGLTSAYHHVMGEAQGAETIPTHYWRDRTKDGPTYHIDYIFMPNVLTPRIRVFEVGTFEDWTGKRLSDHVPLMLELAI